MKTVMAPSAPSAPLMTSSTSGPRRGSIAFKSWNRQHVLEQRRKSAATVYAPHQRQQPRRNEVVEQRIRRTRRWEGNSTRHDARYLRTTHAILAGNQPIHHWPDILGHRRRKHFHQRFVIGVIQLPPTQPPAIGLPKITVIAFVPRRTSTAADVDGDVLCPLSHSGRFGPHLLRRCDQEPKLESRFIPERFASRVHTSPE